MAILVRTSSISQFFLQRCSPIVRAMLASGALLACLSASAEAGTFTLMWDPSPEPNVTGYTVSWGPSSDWYVNTVDVGNQTSFLFTEPDPTVPYYFAIRAYNSAGLVSGFSQEVQSTPTGLVPS